MLIDVFLGQFSLPWDKRQPYETDIRVPFLIRGPGIPKGTYEKYPLSAVDIAPTILDLVKVEIPKNFDGESLKNRLFSAYKLKNYMKIILIEYRGEGNINTVEEECHLYDTNIAVSGN